MSGCLTEDQLAAFVEGALAEDEHQRADSHLTTCESCREAVGHLLVDSAASGRPPRAPPLGAGSAVGRYVLEELVGSGGMGVVFRARDTLLNRKAALKFLHETTHDSALDGRWPTARLAEEAQALAKLNHPHVVAIYDVGQWEDHLFIAMEWVEGGSLARWMKEPRPWREVLKQFCQAGDGLAAAHAVGLVHRDFKPQNVLVGEDGRVRVADFGLVAGSEDASGARVGTPAYMAPEQARGERVDARADQFSFCVALHEALSGERPDPSAQRSVSHPKALRELIERGLSTDPKNRHESMAVLVARLRKVAARRTTRRAALSVAALTLAAVLGLAQQRRASCEQAPSELWTAETRAQMERAFEATGLSLAQDTFTRVSAQLDAYTRAWTASAEDACLRHRVERATPPEVFRLQSDCLARGKQELSALMKLLVKADRQVLQNATSAIYQLPSVADCADTQWLLASRDSELGEGAEVRQLLVESRVLNNAGKVKDSVEASGRALGLARKLAHPGLLAQALVWEGGLRGRLHEGEKAATLLREGFQLALAQRQETLVAQASIDLARTYGNTLHSPEQFELWSQLAQAQLQRTPHGEHLTALLELELARALEPRGSFTEALKRLDSGLKAERAATKGAGSMLEVYLLYETAGAHKSVGDLTKSESASHEAITLATRLFGEHHPATTYALGGLAHLYASRGENARAIPLMRKILAVDEEMLGPQHPMVGAHLSELAQTLTHAGETREALELERRALAIFSITPGREHHVTYALLSAMAETGLKAGLLEDGRGWIDQSVRGLERLFGPNSPELAERVALMGRIADARGDSVTSIRHHRRALAIFEKSEFAQHGGTLARVRFHLAESLWRVGRRGEALEAAATALVEARRADRGELVETVSAWISTHGGRPA